MDLKARDTLRKKRGSVPPELMIQAAGLSPSLAFVTSVLELCSALRVCGGRGGVGGGRNLWLSALRSYLTRRRL